MEIKNIDTFIQVAELCSFTKAAQKLGYSQSTVSFQIKQLEESLNVQLFERINHTVTLTRRGREVLNYAHKMQVLADELEISLKGVHEISGHIKIAMADSLCAYILQDGFHKFHEQYPDVTFKIITASTEQMFDLLDHNEVDFVYTLDSHIYDKEYVIVFEDKVNAHFVAGMDMPLPESEGPLDITQIVKLPFLMTEKGMSYRKPIDELLARKSLEIEPVLEIGDVHLICHLVTQNMGISFLPDFVSEPYIKEGSMRYVEVGDLEIDIWKQLLYHKDKWISPAMNAAINHLYEDHYKE